MTMPMIFLMSAMFLALWPTLGQGQSVSETANLDGATAGTSSTGTGSAVVVLTYANTSLALSTTFAGLTSGTMMAHIHCCTASPGVGTAGPATPLPSLPGFPLGVQNGMSYVVLDMSMVSSYSAPFLAMNGNNATAAWLTLYNGITAGLAYFNIHTISYPNGEIAGFFQENKIQPAPSGPITTSGLGPCNADNGCNSANSGGHCADHACVCNPGFTGYQCETSSNGTTTPAWPPVRSTPVATLATPAVSALPTLVCAIRASAASTVKLGPTAPQVGWVCATGMALATRPTTAVGATGPTVSAQRVSQGCSAKLDPTAPRVVWAPAMMTLGATRAMRAEPAIPVSSFAIVLHF
eukprot:TRINITY_DN384_c0_g1_i13.p1 TRINITY_DN384_c0_g1~~TRINITY_DN384_c0_g1_i13.p1  ORF type:complete len:362 (-),score=2.94 TRINITY_DN384_c0_g1_i13:53-1108(-)